MQAETDEPELIRMNTCTNQGGTNDTACFFICSHLKLVIKFLPSLATMVLARKVITHHTFTQYSR